MKKTITFPDGTAVAADVTRHGVLAVHRSTSKGYVITDLSTLAVVGLWRLKTTAVAVRRALESASRETWPTLLETAFREESAR